MHTTKNVHDKTKCEKKNLHKKINPPKLSSKTGGDDGDW